MIEAGRRCWPRISKQARIASYQPAIFDQSVVRDTDQPAPQSSEGLLRPVRTLMWRCHVDNSFHMRHRLKQECGNRLIRDRTCVESIIQRDVGDRSPKLIIAVADLKFCLLSAHAVAHQNCLIDRWVKLLRIQDFSSRHQFSAKIGCCSEVREPGWVLIKPDLVPGGNRRIRIQSCYNLFPCECVRCEAVNEHEWRSTRLIGTQEIQTTRVKA